MKIALDAGHGVNTPGKRTPDGEREWSFNDKVLRAAGASLRRYKGVQIMRTDDASGKSDVSLAERVRKANAWGADVFVSFHHNAMSGAWHSGGGTEVFTSNGASSKSVSLAKAVAPKVAKAMGLSNRGVKRADFYVIRYTKMPSILVEGGFMDSRVDIKALRDDAKLRAQGEAVAEAIAEVFGLKAGGAQASKPKPPASWYVMSGSRGDRVTQLQRDLTALGYPLTADGIFGKATEAAVRAFQKSQKLAVDGVYGKDSQAAVKKALDAKKKPASKPKPKTKKTIYRVIIDGKQVGAYSEDDNAVREARKAIEKGAKNIRIEKV